MAVTYTQMDTAADCANPSNSATNVVNKKAQTGGTPGSTDVTGISFPSSATRVAASFELVLAAGTTWDSGNWTVRINVTSANMNIDWVSIQFQHLDSACGAIGTVETVALSSAISLGTTGVKTGTVSFAGFTPSAGDKIRVMVWCTNSAMSTQTIAITPNQDIDTPFNIVAGSQSVTPAAATLTLTTFAPTVRLNTILTPATATLTYATFAPTVTLGVRLTPATAAMTFTTFAPSVTATAHVAVTPAPASLTFTTFAPTVVADQKITPATATLTLTTFAPSVILGTRLTPATASLSLTTFAPSVVVNNILTPAPASLTFTTFAPTVTAGSAEPSATLDVVLKQGETTIATWSDVAVSGSIEDIPLTITAAEIANITFPATLTVEMTPTLEGGAGVRIYELDIALPALALTPAPATLTFTTFAPTVTVGTRLTPDPATLTFTTFAPAIVTPVTLTPAAATLTLTTFAPTVSTALTLTPATASLVLTTFAPTVTVDLATSLDITLKQGGTTIKTWTAVEVPDIITDIDLELTEAEIATISFPATLTIEITGYINGSYSIRIYEVYLTVPTEIVGEIVTPSPAAMTLTTFAPTVAVSDNKSLTPATAALTLTTFAPVVTVSDNISLTPATANMTFTTFAPTVTITAHYAVTPLTAALVLLTYAPTVLVEAIDFPGNGRAYLLLLGHAIASVHALHPRPGADVRPVGGANALVANLPRVSGMISPVGAGSAKVESWQIT